MSYVWSGEAGTPDERSRVASSEQLGWNDSVGHN